MSEPNQPIQLDYKTPEKGERVTASMILSRVLVGFCGILGLLGAFALAGITVIVVFDRSTPAFVKYGGALVGLLITVFVCDCALRWLSHAIIGNRRNRRLMIG